MKTFAHHTIRIALISVLLIGSGILSPSFAQFNNPVQDGVIGFNEYGTHIDGQNQQVEGGTTWYMTWNNTDLFIAFTGSNAAEAAVVYLDINPIIPVNGGTDADGSTQGFYAYDRNQSMQPFRADFVAYFKDSYNEYRRADGAGYYTGQTSFGLAAGSNLGTNTVEVAIPWNEITGGNGRPAAFNWHGSKVYDYGPATNGVYSSVPGGNPNCACNQDPSRTFITRYYNVLRTTNFTATKPFSTVSMTYHEDFSLPGIGGYYLNGGAFYDITINDNSPDNIDNDPVNFFYDNQEISNRLLVEGNITIGHNLYIGQGSALLPADNLGPQVLATITMNGRPGSIYNFGRIDPNPEVIGVNDWDNRRIDFVFDGVTRLEATDLFKDRYRLANVTINPGDSLLGPVTDSVEVEFQHGTLDNNGVIDAGDGSAGYLDLATRGDVAQQNDVFFNSSSGSGVWMLHDFLIGRNSSTLRAVNGGRVVPLQIKGDFENYDDFLAIDGSGRIDVVMNGRFRQEILGNTVETTGATTTFHNLEIANASGLGDYNNSADVHFTSFGGGTIDYIVTGELRLTSGDLVTRDRASSSIVHKLRLDEGATVAYPGAASNLTTAGSCFIDGPLTWEVATASPILKEFPIGKSQLGGGYLLGDYRLLQLLLDHDLASSTEYTAEMFLADRSAFYTWPVPTPEVITWISQQRYWNVTKGPGASVQSAQITLDYDIDEQNDGVTNPGGLRIVKDDGAGNWVNIAAGGGGTGVGTGMITSNPFTTFSDFTLASIDGGMPLAVTLTAFDASLQGESVYLRWSTNLEINSDHFIVERSRDEVEFAAIGRVEAAGNSAGPMGYGLVDEELEAGVSRYYYRLRMVDLDGTYQYSELRSVALDGTAELDIFPNPATESVAIRAEGAELLGIQVYNSLGQQVRSLEGRGSGIQLDVTELAAGAYFVQVQTQSGVWVAKLMVRK